MANNRGKQTVKRRTKATSIKKGAHVLCISGDDKRRWGEVLRVQGDKVIVRGLNLCKKHVKKSQMFPEGGINTIERPIHVSNLRLCDSEGKPLKLKRRVNDQGEVTLVTLDGNEERLYKVLRKAK